MGTTDSRRLQTRYFKHQESSWLVGNRAAAEVLVQDAASRGDLEELGTAALLIRNVDVGVVKNFLKRYREDMVLNGKKKSDIEVKLAEFEERLRRQLLKEKLEKLNHPDDAVKNSLDQGAMPTIHVSIGQLSAAKAPQQPRVSGD